MKAKLFKNILMCFVIMLSIFAAGCDDPFVLQPPVTDPYADSSGIMSVHFVDVGQGDSILILLPNSQVVLVDAGTTASSDYLVNYLKSQDVSVINYLVSTHPHEDHIGGMLKVLDTFEVSAVLDPAYAHTTRTFQRYLEKIDELNIPFIPARSGASYQIGDVKFDILWPDEVRETEKDVNEISIVILVTYGDFSLLLTGDIGSKTESAILKNYDLGKIDVLKVPHHGSKGSSSATFINAIEPQISVISLGEGNTYGHPTQEALDRLSNSQIYRTDISGDIVIETDGIDISIYTTK